MDRKFWKIFSWVVKLGLVIILAISISMQAKEINKVKFFDKRLGKSIDVVAERKKKFVNLSKHATNPTNVPVAPNASLIKGKVLKYSILNSKLENIQPERTLHSLVIEVFSSEPANEEEPSFVKIGEKIEVFSHKKIPSEVFDKNIKAEVSLEGDERGQKFWLRNFEILEQKRLKNKDEE